MKACPGDSESTPDQQFESLYRKAREIAGNIMNRQRTGHTFRPTDLTNEAYVRFLKQNREDLKDDRTALCLLVVTMRNILIDHARARGREKRGGGRGRVDLEFALDQIVDRCDESVGDVTKLGEVLAEWELSKNPAENRYAQIINMRFFAGIDLAQTAAALDMDARTVQRQFKVCREILKNRLSGNR